MNSTGPQLNPIAANQTELTMGDLTVFYSYKTPVAAHVAGVGYFRTAQRYSMTTSRHINQWLTRNGATMDKVQTVEQARIDGFAAGKAV